MFVKAVGDVNVLASKKSTPKVGTTVHTIAHSTVCGNLGMCNVCENCGKLMASRVRRFGDRGIDGVVRVKNAVLGATHYGRFAAPRKQTRTCRGVGGRRVSTLIVVNNSNSLANTHVFTRRFSIPYVNLPKAVSGSLCKASAAVNCSATLGAVLSTMSGVHSATASRRHLFFIRIVKHSTNFLTLGNTVTTNTRTTVVPRFDARISRLRRFVRRNFHGSGDDDVMLMTRDRLAKNTVRCTRHIGGRCPRCSIHMAVLKRLRHNKHPATRSQVVTDHVKITDVRTLLRKRHGMVVNVSSSGVICMPFTGTVGGSGPVSERLIGMLRRLSVWFLSAANARGARVVVVRWVYIFCIAYDDEGALFRN